MAARTRPAVMPREEEFRLRYGGRFGIAFYAEWKAKAPVFGGQPFTLDYSITGGRRCRLGALAAREPMEIAIKAMIRDGVLDGELLPGGKHVRVRGWALDKMPRHPAFKPQVGDTGTRQGRTLQVFAIDAMAGMLTLINPENKRTVEWTTFKWADWAKGADFSKAFPLVTGVELPEKKERKPRAKKATKAGAAATTTTTRTARRGRAGERTR